MREKDLEEFEEYDSRVLDEGAAPAASLPSSRADGKFGQRSVELRVTLEGPFLLGGSGEITSETEKTEAVFGEVGENPWRAESYEAEGDGGVRAETAHEQANPAAADLHEMLHSAEMQQATMATLLGKGARSTVQVDGSEMGVLAYLREVSRLAEEVAEQFESGRGGTGVIEEEIAIGVAAAPGTGACPDDGGLPGPLPFSKECQKKLVGLKVAVLGGGLAGLMAARRLGEHGVKVTLFEARSQLGGRVRSNTTFSEGRVTEEGAELIGAFHTTWLALARYYGIAVINRMDEDFYRRAGLSTKLTLDKPLCMGEIDAVEEEMKKRVLGIFTGLAATNIKDPSKPWEQEKDLRKFDITVAEALGKFCGVDKKKDARLWKAVEFLMVNDEVAPLEEMSFLGLLCKVKGGQGRQFRMTSGTPTESNPMGYWEELEIFRCADGCQTLATKMAEEIKSKNFGAQIQLSKAATEIDISKQGVTLKVRASRDDGRISTSPAETSRFDYAILAIPPSVWDGVTITANGKDADPKKDFGLMAMGPAIKFFTNVKERFWIKEKAAPWGGSSDIGQIWEGTDNQTHAGNQGTVLSVFAGPIVGGKRAPVTKEIKTGLGQLYKGYAGDPAKEKYVDWPNEAFIKTGYASPRPGQIFNVGKNLNMPYRERMFFAGEHTQMDSFGYMEGALRSGQRAAEDLMRLACNPPARSEMVAETNEAWSSEGELGGAEWQGRGFRRVSVPESEFQVAPGTNVGVGAAAQVTVDPFPTSPYVIALANNPALNPIVELAKKAEFKDLCVAVIDLTGDPSYVGFNDDDMLYVGSLQKISAMYAAFELRSRVQKHLDAVGLPANLTGDWQQKVFDDLKATWKPKIDAQFPAALPKGFPDLKGIFTISNLGKVDFRSTGQTGEQLDHIDGGSAVGRTLGFAEQLSKMIRWSDNHSASHCILALGYPYINAALKGAGLFDPGPPPKGLWVSGNYADSSKDWLRDITVDDAKAGQPKTPRWTHTTSPPRMKTNFGATARQVARLVAMIEQETLVDKQASREMKGLMTGAELNDPQHRNESMSYVDLALREAGREVDKVFSKIGIGDGDGTIHDCAIVERTVTDSWGDSTFRYVVVGLGAPGNLGTKPNPGPFLKLFVEIDKVIKVK